MGDQLTSGVVARKQVKGITGHKVAQCCGTYYLPNGIAFQKCTSCKKFKQT